MFTKTLACLAVFTAIASPVFAHEMQQQHQQYQPPQQHSLISADVAVGSGHGSVAAVSAKVGSSNSLANVSANLLGGLVKANVAVDQTSHHSDTLLGLNLSLDGGVGNRH
jgi:hypothetical protein